MSNIATLCQRINDNYILYQSDKSVENDLFRDLSAYLDYVLLPLMNDPTSRADVLQNTLIKIFRKGLKQYQADKSGFSTYCAMIAKNAAKDFLRQQQRQRCSLKEDNILENAGFSYDGTVPTVAENPEHIRIRLVEHLTAIEAMKKCLRLFYTLDKPAPWLVSSGFSIFVGRKHHPRSKKLTFTNWAYKELKKSSVRSGNIRFGAEMYEWIPSMHFMWGSHFNNSMHSKDEKNGCFVHELIFGEHFTEKDFENWCKAIRQQLKKQMMLNSYSEISLTYGKDNTCTLD